MAHSALQATINEIVIRGKGILAADESTPTITKRFANVGVESSEESRRDYRELLFSTPGIEEFISGVILFEETLGQNAKDGTPLPMLLSQNGIVPGIKVDKGLLPIYTDSSEKVTQGLDNLGERLEQYKARGARFAKWRAVFTIGDHFPSDHAIHLNAQNLARYAAICQDKDIVPIVEPELLIEGKHSIEACAQATERTLHAVFHTLYHHKVFLEGIILKPSMVISGTECPEQADVHEVANATLQVLERTVPAAVPTINFLSGGQTDELATAHLNAMNATDTASPWYLSFSYGRALQAACLEIWAGAAENTKAAQNALLKRARLNSAATFGEYNDSME